MKKITLEISDQDTDDLENAIEKFNRLMELLEDLSLSVHEIKEMLKQEVRAWTMKRNRRRKKINWTFTKQKADEKLGKYYTE